MVGILPVEMLQLVRIAISDVLSLTDHDSANLSSNANPNPNAISSFPSKTDKPRPHVCTICTRPFARLEHLKRHERSHTKEKPFTCGECSRSFARRDLLLRHQQKLHTGTTPSSRPRSGRRESTAGSGRVRKNSIANTGTSGMRPRANTLSHVVSHGVDSLNLLTGSTVGEHDMMGNSIHEMADLGLPGVSNHQYRGMSNTQQGSHHSLPRLNTSALPVEYPAGPRTAPAFGQFPTEFSMSSFGFGPSNTINPNQLHMGNIQNYGLDDHRIQIPYARMFPEGDRFDWNLQGMEQLRYCGQPDESAIEGSSPSVMDTNSPSRVSEGLPDGTASMINGFPASSSHMWSGSLLTQPHLMSSPGGEYPPNIGIFSDMNPVPQGTASPGTLLPQGGTLLDTNAASPSQFTGMDSSSMIPGFQMPDFSMMNSVPGEDSGLGSPGLVTGLRHSSTTTVSSDLINDNTRSSLLSSLAQYGGFGPQSFAGSVAGSPASQKPISDSQPSPSAQLPSTPVLQKYLDSYIQYFHPHLPFLHLPSLNFESSEYNVPSRMINPHSNLDHAPMTGGGWCLMLAITAIGALYDRETTHSRQLFEAGKQMITTFLEERRRANLSRTGFGHLHQAEAETTPLWLVQAMLLIVIYGYNCGDKAAAENAASHCATLVTLARGAELARAHPGFMVMTNGTLNPDIQMNASASGNWDKMVTDTVDNEWLQWKIVEERKRTLYAIFVLSSSLVVAYSCAPVVTNTEIWLGLPCDEALWEAENAGSWGGLGGKADAETPQALFHAAFGHLLTAAQRQGRTSQTVDTSRGLGVNDPSDTDSDLKLTSFGSLILIHALHNYIWETRQRHIGPQWTRQDTETNLGHLEPALHAWQAAWAANSSSSAVRPNPFGAGPISADCLPLLELAHIRLLVNFARPKEVLWEQDPDARAEILAGMADLSSNSAGHSPSSSYDESNTSSLTNFSGSSHGFSSDFVFVNNESEKFSGSPLVMSRLPPLGESHTGRSIFATGHLRQAACYAVDSLAVHDDQIGGSSLELPFQSAICVYECAQVVTEWIGALQDCVGPQVGLINAKDHSSTISPFDNLVEEEDRKLLDNIWHLVEKGESRIPFPSFSGHLEVPYLGSRVLNLMASQLEKAAVWQGLYSRFQIESSES